MDETEGSISVVGNIALVSRVSVTVGKHIQGYKILMFKIQLHVKTKLNNVKRVITEHELKLFLKRNDKG